MVNRADSETPSLARVERHTRHVQIRSRAAARPRRARSVLAHNHCVLVTCHVGIRRGDRRCQRRERRDLRNNHHRRRRGRGVHQNPVADAHLTPQAAAVLRLDIPVVGLPALQRQSRLRSLGCRPRGLPANEITAAGIGGRRADGVLILSDAGFGIRREPCRVELGGVGRNVTVIRHNRACRRGGFCQHLHLDVVDAPGFVVRRVCWCTEEFQVQARR